jgi:UDP-glucuronate decarboxylase
MTSKIVTEDIATIVRSLGADAQRFSGKTILITGSAGFLGRYFIGTFAYLNEHVLTEPCRILALDNFITGSHHPDFNYRNDPNIIEVWGDVTQPLPVREDLNFVIHAAGIASPVFYRQYPLETIEGAVNGTRNLLEMAQHNKLEGFVFFSSSEIYGDPDPSAVPTPETYHGYVSSVGPRACYDESKRLGETICTIYHQRFGIPTRIIRPFNIFGPGMGYKDKRVVPMFTYKALNGENIPVHGSGEQTRTFCYITDGIAGFLKVLLNGKDGEAYNIGNEQNEISMVDLAKAFTQVTGTSSKVTLIEYPESYPAGEPMRRCPDLTKARREVGYEPQVDMYEGINRFIEWAKADPSYRLNDTTKQ